MRPDSVGAACPETAYMTTAISVMQIELSGSLGRCIQALRKRATDPRDRGSTCGSAWRTGCTAILRRRVSLEMLRSTDEILRHDLMLHIHSKASPQSFGLLWNDFLLHSVCGSPAVTSAILRYFAENESLGLVYPPYFGLKRNQPDWGSNREICARLYSAITGDALAARCPDYPAGSFFWARTRYLQPLFDLELTDTDFPEEMSQSDGTLAHAVERMIGLLDKPTGMVKQCVSVTPPLSLDDLAGMGNG